MANLRTQRKFDPSQHKKSLPAILALATSALWALPVSADPLRPGSTVLVSHYPDGTPADGRHPSVSSAGRYVAFESFDPITPDKPFVDSTLDVFVSDIQTGEITRIPKPNPLSSAMRPSISGDGTKVAYITGPCCSPGVNAYVYDRTTGTNTLIKRPPNRPWGSAAAFTISRDGTWAALVAQIPADVEADGWYELWVSDTSTGASRWLDFAGIDNPPAISADGRFVAYQNGGIWLYDRDVSGSGAFDQPGNTSNTPVPGSWTDPAISDDGNKVAFRGGTNQIHVYDTSSGNTELASQSSQGIPGTADPLLKFGDRVTAISGNGSYVAFPSFDAHLAPPDLNPQRDIYVRELGAQTTRLVSYLPDGTQGVGDRFTPALSQDGRFVAFGASESYEGRLYALEWRVYLRDLLAPCSIACLVP